MKKGTRITISFFLLLGVLMTNFLMAEALEPRYVGVSQLFSSLEISSRGAASCCGWVVLRSGYTADVKVELKQDVATIKTWTSSGSGSVTAEGTYYVASGHDYVVTTTATVYGKDGKIVENPSKDSVSSHY